MANFFSKGYAGGYYNRADLISFLIPQILLPILIFQMTCIYTRNFEQDLREFKKLKIGWTIRRRVIFFFI